MDFKIIETNIDYISLTFKFFDKTPPKEITSYIREEIVPQLILNTTLSHNQWFSIANRRNQYRSTGGMTMLIYTNLIILQISGEAMLYLDEFDIKDIIHKARHSIYQARRLDFEKLMDIEYSESIGRIDSQVTIQIPNDKIGEIFDLEKLTLNGRLNIFTRIIDGIKNISGIGFLKNREINIYQFNQEQLVAYPRIVPQKRDFFRIYDKIREVIETTNPNSEKRKAVLNKFGAYIDPDTKIFRIEVEERDRAITKKYLPLLLDEKNLTFEKIAIDRIEQFAKRNPFILLDTVLCAIKAHKNNGV